MKDRKFFVFHLKKKKINAYSKKINAYSLNRNMIAKSIENEFYFLAKITVSKIVSSIQSKFAGTMAHKFSIKSEIILVVAENMIKSFLRSFHFSFLSHHRRNIFTRTAMKYGTMEL